MVKVEIPQGLTGSVEEKLVDEDLAAFTAWLNEHVDPAPLTGPEKAILKTYLWYKTHPGQAPNPVG